MQQDTYPQTPEAVALELMKMIHYDEPAQKRGRDVILSTYAACLSVVLGRDPSTKKL